VRIGEVAERAGVNVETLRYYERRGLLPEPPRREGGHREYGADAIRFVRAVKEAQRLGFSLAEIEEYLRLARRDPGAASETARERLEGKLEDVDAALAALRTRRAGLARGGRDPVLAGPLHVTNGESVVSTLRATSLEGVVLSWDDVLHVGPLAYDPEESRALRSRFLAEQGWGREDAIHAELTRRDELLAQAKRIVLWFEHDLVDQLQLLQALAQLGDDVEVELVQADDHLGPLEAVALERLWPSRRPVGREARELAREAWRGVCADEIEPVAVEGLPHLEAALARLLEERALLPRTKRQLLAALRDGPLRPLELFAANQAQEEAVFLGDTWCFLHLWELARDGLVTPELPLRPPRGDYDAFTVVPLELTPAGRRLV
jgi:DNA-binding transcriptional MerR regulator